MKITKHVALIALLCISLQSEAKAQWWNPMAPKDYDECILKYLKPGMGKEAVWAVQNSCNDKFAPKQSAAERDRERILDERYKKCELPRDHYKKTFVWFGLSGRRVKQTTAVLSKIKGLKYDGSANRVSFQNTNNFGVSVIALGFTNATSCSNNEQEYLYTTFCRGGSTENGVGGISFGSLNCGELPKDAIGMRYCLIGFSPLYDKFDSSLLDFVEKNGLC